MDARLVRNCLRAAFVLLAVCAAALALAQGGAVEHAWALVANGHRSAAVQLLTQIIQKSPNDADARLLLGSILMEEGKRAESIEQLTTAVRLRPDSAKAQNALGEALNAFGEPGAAFGHFEKAAELDPGFPQAQVNLGAVLLKEGKPSQAEPHLDRAIELLGNTEDSAYPRYLRAKIYSERGQMKRAEADLEKAVALEPDFAEAWSDLGEARKILLDDAAALAAFEKAVEFAPQDPIAQTRLGSELLDQNQTRQALPHLEKAVQLDPENQSALYNLERALRRAGQAEEAGAVRKKLAALLLQKDRLAQSAFEAVQINDQGVALEKAGKLRQALQKYREALQLDPQHVGIRMNLAAALLHLGLRDQGIAQLHEALARDPDNPAIKKALKDALNSRSPAMQK